MSKITVKTCLGTTCFIMGGSDLQDLSNIIPQRYGDKVSIEASPCLELCHANVGYAKAPFVKIDDDVITEATLEKVLEAIEKRLEQI